MRLFYNNTGFSLIELLTVLAIIALLVAIAIPSYLGIKNKANASRLIKTAQSSISELQFWIQSSLSTNSNLIQVDTNFDGKIDASDKTNSQLLSDGVANTYATERNARLEEKSPWFSNISLWSADSSIPNGRITLIQTSNTMIKVIGKDKEGNLIYENSVSAD